MPSSSIAQSIAIIIPAFNEELTIRDVIFSFAEVLPDALIVVVDNASTDQTFALATAAMKESRARGVVLQEASKGKANAVRRAFLEVEADVYLMVDADFTYPAAQAWELLEPVLQGKCDMTVGDRISNGAYSDQNNRPAHQFGNWLVTYLVNRLFAANLKDILSGYRVFNRRFVQNYPILIQGFELEVDITLFALDARQRIVEIPISYRERPEGSVSKLNTIADGARVINTILQIVRHYRPMYFFGNLALLFFVLGLLAGMPAIVEFFQYQYVSRVPLAILAVGLEILASLSFTTGLILSTIVRGQKAVLERALISQRSSGVND